MRLSRIAFAFLGAALSAQTAPAAKALALTQGATPLVRRLQELCDGVGGRVTGSPAYQKALDWGLKGFQEAGVPARLEPFPMPARWEAGPVEAAALGEGGFPLHVASWGWSAGADGEFRLVDGGSGSPEELAALGAKAKGAFVLIRTRPMQSLMDLFGEYMSTAAYVPALEKAGAAGVLSLSTRPLGLLYRHVEVGDGRVSRLPEVLVAREDGLRLGRLLDDRGEARIRVRMANRIGGAFESKNVVAELPGGELKDEVVLVGAHLDSWDLGTGALDNGCNAAMVVELARVMRQMGTPKRTVRFVLFGGEEQGLLGSKGYVSLHRAEMDRHRAVLIYDEGVGRVSGYSTGGRKDWDPVLRELLAPLGAAAPAQHTPDAFVGTDNYDFLVEGVPNLVANQDPAPYLPNYHAQSDTFDKVDPRDLQAQAGEAAVLLWGLANAPELPRRQTRAEVDATLKATQLDEQMKAFGTWEAYAKGERGRKP